MNFESDINLQDLCRLCLKSFTHFPSTTGGMFKHSHSLQCPRLSKLYLELTTLNVCEESKEFPKRVCTPCRRKLIEYDELRKMAIKSTKKLHGIWSNRADKGHNVTTVIKIESDGKEEYITPEPVTEDMLQNEHDNERILPELNIKDEPVYEFVETKDINPCLEDDFPISNHQLSNTVQSPANSLEDTYGCSICSYDYHTKRELQEHMREHAVPCTQCSKVFSSRNALNRHVSVVHMGKKRFKCSYITPETATEDMLQNEDDNERILPELNIKEEPVYEYVETKDITPCLDHQLSKTVQSPANSLEDTYRCSICSYDYHTKRELQEHMREHAVHCTQCSKVFSSRNALNRHVSVVHMGKKRFNCSYCSLRFGTLVSLIHHERQHTGERPYTCGICGKGFIQKKSLTAHMKSC